MAYTIYKELERRLALSNSKISVESAIREIKDIQKITYTLPQVQKDKISTSKTKR